MKAHWDQEYARDVPPDFDEMRKREDRKERIIPYWDLLVSDKEPKINKPALLRLMQDLKDEGNALFKDKHYDIAWMHYRNALFVARILENRFYHQVEKEFVSTLFSNRAFCWLKKEMFNEAVQDCESAIKIFPSNLKAYYRQAVAFKHQKKYKEAVKAVQQGQQIQQSSALKDLLDELLPLVDPQTKKGLTESKVEVSAKSDAQAVQEPTANVPDTDWLAGTNITVTEKPRARMPSKKTKKPKPAGKSPSAKNNGTVYDHEAFDIESDETNSSLGEDDEKFANSLKGVRRQKFGRTAKDVLDLVRPNVAEEDTAWTFPHDADGNVAVDRGRIPQKTAAVGTRTVFDSQSTQGSMGLDSFGLDPVSADISPEIESIDLSDMSSRRSSRSSQSPVKSSSGTSSPFVKQPSPPATKPAAEPIPTIYFPLEDEFNFKLACRLCFRKIGEGIKGFTYVPASHSCLKDLLIVKLKNKQGINWIKVRQRPDSQPHFYGQFKICSQFSQGTACKVGEEKCTFAHHQAELRLWTLDRDGKFNIGDFITKCKEYKIDTSEAMEQAKSKQHYIPGLNFVGDKGKKKGNSAADRPPEPAPKKMSHAKPPPPSPASSSYVMSSPGHQHMSPHAPPNRQQSPNMRGAMPPHYPPPYYPHQMPPPNMPPQMPGQHYYMPPGAYQGSYSQHEYYQGQQDGRSWSRPAPAIMQPPEQVAPPESVGNIENPLAATHAFKIVCSQCFKVQGPGLYEYLQVTHKCEENVLAMRAKAPNGRWLRVRERTNHREFPGKYILCRCISYNNPIYCRYGEDNCSFAHNPVEQHLWTLEKEGQFNITEFIMQNRKQAQQGFSGFSLKEILVKHGGYFDFICRSCYYATPARITREGNNHMCAGDPPHKWKDFKILAHMGGPGGVVTVLNPRGFLHKTAFFKICKWLHYCSNKVNGECRFAHSMVERDVWMLERDTGISRKDVVQQSKALQNIPSSAGDKSSKEVPPSAATPPTSTGKTHVNMTPSEAATYETVFPGDNMCPFVVWEVCETCWKKGQKTFQEGNKDRCLKGHANWVRNKVYVLSPSNKEIRSLPKKIPSGLNFIICKYIRQKSKCGYTGGGPCQFAHSSEELDAWKWMVTSRIQTLDKLYEVSQEAQKTRAESAKQKISGQLVVDAKSGSLGAAPAAGPTFPVSNFSMHYCHYCGITCNSQKQWDEHCASEKHNFNVNSDKEHQWNFRQPPWGIGGRSYELCPKHMDGNKCQYSHVPEMYNLCRYAHSQEELDEWKERYEWRLMKREMARQEKVFSYMDQLQEKYEASLCSIKVISETLDNVNVMPSGDLNIYKEEKNATHTWTFEIQSNKPLEKVALLNNRDRLHFAIVGVEKGCQISPGEPFKVFSDSGSLCYRVGLQYSGGMFGSFQQWIIFDFGTEPVLCQKITVEVGTQSSHEKVRHLREQLNFDRWSSQNREIVFHESGSGLPIEETLLTKYKEATSSELVVTQATVLTELNRYNYIPKMHKLIALEEMTRHQIISSFNMCTEIQCLESIQEGVFVFAHPGELFAKVPLQENLTEDTDAGKLILTSVRTVLLAPQNDSSKAVYEATIVREENFNYDGRGREYIYLCLSPQCVRNLGLKGGAFLSVEIQFQMNRLFFCRMHHAVDQLKTTGIVFPDVPKINPLRNETHDLRISSSVLNPDQMAAVRHIVAVRTGYTPPFIIFGPFGTGKTETMAQATMVLLKERADSRILICAQSNSAADLYITKHLDNFLKKSTVDAKLRRVYFRERRVYTVPEVVKKYCLLSSDKMSFEIPSQEDIMKHRVVIVTVNTALVLTKMELQGFFTHIFIDEAAQSFECETLMPLAIATEKTCVVLAGDHKQISPKVYSEEAKEQRFHMSMLERLYAYYDSHSSLISETSPLNILLSINYRTKMEILRFISAIFYGGPDRLVSEANIPSVLEVTPLVFYAVQGHDIQDENSISYYNMSEVKEVVERVDDLFQKWPMQWGERNAKEIGVVTPYYDQVQFIRRSLRKKNEALKDIVVERIHNMQGKEFRALFLSTVRTRHLIEAPHVQSGALTECDGDGGDFGFLSDPKLLNTALTRAQSLVVVVGDPVALCAIGECVNVWRTYLKHCQNMGSLFPHTHNFQSIRQQVQNLLNSPARERLLQIANQRQQSSTAQSRSKVATSEAPARPQAGTVSPGLSYNTVTQGLRDGEQKPNKVAMTAPQNTVPTSQPVPMNSLQNSQTRAPVPGFQTQVPGVRPPAMNGLPQMPRPPAPLKMLPKKKVERFVELGQEDSSISSDDILRQLVRIAETGGSQTEPFQLSGIQFKEEAGHAVLQYSTASREPKANHVIISYSPAQLQELLLRSPDKYKVGILHIERERIYIELRDKSPYQLEIGSRSQCGEAFNRDEVVVEVLETQPSAAGDVALLEGCVVGVTRRALDPTGRCFVCSVEGGSAGVLVPLNTNMSRMYNAVSASILQNRLDSQVCVYRFTTDMQLRFSHYEELDPATPSKMLFIVRYLKWDCSLSLPLGVVIGALPAGTDVSSGLQVLGIEHGAQKKFQTETTLETDHLFHEGYQLPPETFNTRVDMRDRWSFTIESSTAEDLNEAFSIDENEDGSYLIGVHISDVSFFVKKGSCVDAEALNRGSSMFPLNNSPVHMLPPRLSTDLCSLRPNADRVTLSVLMTVQATGEISHAMVQKTILNSKKKFSYQEAEEVLQDPNAHEDYLKSCVLVLYQISRIWRKERLGNAYTYQDLTIQEKLAPFTRQLVQEMMIMSEHQVTKMLINRFPQSIPLYCQGPPNEVLLNVWKQEHAADAVNSIALTRPFLEGSATCKCKVACTCIVNYIRRSNMKVRDNVDVVASLWDTLTQAADINDYVYMQNMVVAAENHPQMALALLKLSSIQSESKYVCSSDVAKEEQFHYTFNQSPYTHFAKPIRRYMDIVTQRMVTACIDNQPCPYSTQEVQTVCMKLNGSKEHVKQYEDDVHALYLSSALQAKPVVSQPLVQKVDKDVELRFPAIPDVPAVNQTISTHLLGVSEISAPVMSDSNVIMKWQERVYDLPNGQTVSGSNSGELNTDRFIYKIPAFQWQRLLIAVREENFQKLSSAVEMLRKQTCNPGLEGNYIDEVTSEVKKLGKVKHFAEFWMNFHQSAVLQVQICSSVIRGMLMPSVQLINLTSKLDICIEHRANPDKCFVDVSSVSCLQSQYRDEGSYKQVFEPIINLESACRAVNSEERLIIRGVTMQWRAEMQGTTSSQCAQLSLPLLFCKERQIKLSSEAQIRDIFCEGNNLKCQSYFADFFCVRYNNLSLADDPALNDSIALLVNGVPAITWVGHCVVTSVVKNNDQLTFNLKLQQSSVPLPSQLLQAAGSNLQCTVEMILRTVTDRHIDYSLRALPESSSLAKDIALGRTSADKNGYRDVEALCQLGNSIPHPLNPEQAVAIEQAVRKPFTVVKGVPGSGKTSLAARLSFLYSQRNKAMRQALGVQSQVLLCAPTEAALDRLADCLLGMGGNCPLLLRVYSKDVEHKVYPVPGKSAVERNSNPSGDCTVVNPDYKCISLHEMIRHVNNPYHQPIQEFDTLFTLYPDDMSEEQVDEYQHLMRLAEHSVLKDCDIVLATCSTSSTSKIANSVNIQQIIIDDCSMCTEPEALIPIVAYNDVKQVTILGDEKQLKPVVSSASAARLGLDRSLIQRYSDVAIPLTTQYRVHEAIIDFPSQMFYANQVKSGNVVQRQPSVLTWPGGRAKPFAFCHTVGSEERQTAGGRDTGADLIYNEAEADLMVRIVRSLVGRFQVPEGNIAVLSPFKGQCDVVQKKLLQYHSATTVSSVLAAQGGEWDYVLFSTVRSQPVTRIERLPSASWKETYLGPLTDQNLMNVAITRARKGLIIIGNRDLLACDEFWRKLLSYYDREKNLASAADFLKTMSM